MTNEEIKKREIESALAAMSGGDFLQTSKHLLEVLDYHAPLTEELLETVDNFIHKFPAENENTKTEQEFRKSAKSIELVSQVGSDEIADSQPDRFESRTFDGGLIQSFVFCTVELKDKDYSRSKYAQFTREVNKRLPLATVVFFRVENRLTIGFVGRRQHKRDPNLDVLEQVTLIKDIHLDEPHRAHLDILFELSLPECAKWMVSKNQPENFDGLLTAWLTRLDTSELNKRFFNELANWYFWAVDQVRFPDDAGEDVEVRNATSVIRLLTRLIFVWFIKEKGLVPDALFNPNDLEGILNNLDPHESTYYKAILQNLFFATLNQEMNTPQSPNNRKFRGEGRQHYNITSLYRYKDYFIDPDDALRKFETIPFLNGGLFECLDAPSKENATRILRVDGFSDRDDNPLRVTNELFFSGEQTVDLNAAYGTNGKRHKVRGLIHILSSYKFTITENTPIEEEVALDPELLGKVFENLLAAYNPETEATARKQTGSYYTPREIVNYMTDESLIAYLKNELITYSEAQNIFSVTTPPSQLDFTKQADPVQTELDVETVSLSDEQKSEIEKKLRELFAYNDEPNPFDGTDTKLLIEAIDILKILDPAVGSGAFPMGVLHRLVFILGKLDLRNEQWKQRQIDRVENTIEIAGEIDDSTIRESTIRDLEGEIESINEAFARNELDYGRKLYLIENCIYGVDIQPIATQIAKLRFFISLIVDQQIDESQENRGVRPLPNLETKFVAANALIGVDRPLQTQIRNPQIDRKEKELEDVRRRHFTARTPRTKAKYRDLDAQIRTEIGELLKGEGFPHETTEKIAHWDPYDQNVTADFFDPEWMFGVRDGFDVVIGNPPYLNVELVSRSEKDSYARIYKTFYKRYDVFGLFIEKSLMTLVPKGTVTYIVPSQVLNNLSYRKLRELILSNMWLKEVCYLGDKVFKTANNDVCILFLQKPAIRRVRLVNALDFENRTSTQVEPGYFDKFDGVISVSVDESEDALFDKIFNPAFEPIKAEFEVFQGIVTGRNDAYILSKQQIRQARIERELLHPVLLGRDFEKWRIRNIERRILYLNSNTDIKKYPNVAKWLLPHRDRLEQRRECRNGTISWYALQWAREKSRLDYTPKILVQGTRNPRLRTRIVATIDDIGVYGTQGLNFIISKGDSPSVYYLLGILNSSLINYVYLRKFLNVAIKAEYLKNTPIPICSDKEQQRLIALVKRTLTAKRADPGADVSALENKIDQIVYLLYDLTPEEIAIVKAAKNV